MIISSCIRVAANGVILLLLLLINPHCMYVPRLPTHLLMDAEFAPTSWLLWMMLLRTLGCMYLLN